LLAVGAVGVISVASHWAGDDIGEMISAFFKGDVDSARAINARLIESWRFETGETTPNPIPAKAMLATMGLPGGACRLPLGPAPTGLGEDAAGVLHRLQAARMLGLG
jgi:4-hydroxy-tetrahydrodipicolinate synthase